MFEDVQNYGMSIFDAKEEQLKSYLSGIMKWVKGKHLCSKLFEYIYATKVFLAADWMLQETVTAIVLVILNPESNDVMERWAFNIVCDKTAVDENGQLYAGQYTFLEKDQRKQRIQR